MSLDKFEQFNIAYNLKSTQNFDERELEQINNTITQQGQNLQFISSNNQFDVFRIESSHKPNLNSSYQIAKIRKVSKFNEDFNENDWEEKCTDHQKLNKYSNSKLKQFQINTQGNLTSITMEISTLKYNDNEIQYHSQLTGDTIISLEKLENQFPQDKIPFGIIESDFRKIQRSIIQKGYKITGFIIKGGEAFIFKGQNKKDKKCCAFRIQKMEYSPAKYYAEYQLVNRIKNPLNIIKYYDYISLLDINYSIIILEKCQQSLKTEIKDKLAEQTWFSREEQLKIIFNLVDGLIEMSQNNIVHLDIKPENILKADQEDQGDENEYLFADFGISQKSKRNLQTDVEVHGQTRKYSSPEQLNAFQNLKQKVSYPSDIFSFGKILIEQKIYQNFNDKEKFEKTVETQLLNIDPDQREQAQDLPLLFLKFVSSYDKEFLLSYKQKVLKILEQLEQDRYDTTKNMIYLHQVNLKYNFVYLEIILKLESPDFDYIKAYEGIGNAYKTIGDLPNALKNYQQALKYKSQSDIKSEAKILTSIGVCLKSQRLINDAINILNQALNLYKKYYGSENTEDIANCYDQLGSCYKVINNKDQALENIFKCLNIRENLQGDDRNVIKIAQTKSHIANSYRLQGKQKEALKYYKDTYKIYKENIKQENHPSIAKSLNNIGNCYKTLGKAQKAYEKYYKKSLHISQEALGEVHPLTACFKNNIALCIAILGKHEEAQQYCLEALNIYQNFLYPEDSSNIAFVYWTLSWIQLGLGRPYESIKYSNKSLEIYKKQKNVNQSKLASCFNNLGLCYEMLGQHEKALSKSIKTMEIRQKENGQQHNVTSVSYYNVGLSYLSIHNIELAFQYHEKALDIRLKFFKEFQNHPDIAQSLEGVGLCYLKQNQIEKALDYQQQSLEMRLKLYDEIHPTVADSYTSIAFCQQNIQKKIIYHKKSLEIRSKLYPTLSHIKVAHSLSDIARCYEELERYDQSILYYKQSLDVYLDNKFLEDDHLIILKLKQQIQTIQKFI